MERNGLSNLGRGSPKEPSCKIILKSVKPFWRRSCLKQKVDNARMMDDFLVGCSGFNGPLRQYFSLYRAISQREGERKEK